MRDETGTDERGIARRRVLEAGIGALTAGAVGLSLTGTAAAHFPEQLDVDVRPGSDENRVVPHGRGFVPVLVRATEYEEDGETVRFDPTEEPVRYRFGTPDVVGDGGGARPFRDGHALGDALFLLFPLDGTGIDEEATEVRIEWERTEEGSHGLSGTDSVTVVSEPDQGRPGHGKPGHGRPGHGWPGRGGPGHGRSHGWGGSPAWHGPAESGGFGHGGRFDRAEDGWPDA